MSMTMKLVLSCIGVFLGGVSQFWGVHQTDPFGPRLWIGLVFAGVTPLGAYFVGLAQKAPWESSPTTGGDMKTLVLLPLVFAVALVGCATPALAGPFDLLGNDLKAALADYQAAKAAGVPNMDSRIACLTGVIGAVDPLASMKLEVKGVVSLGATLDIAINAAGGTHGAIDASCQQLVGQLVIQGARQANPLRLP